jgi:hypothetical protein
MGRETGTLSHRQVGEPGPQHIEVVALRAGQLEASAAKEDGARDVETNGGANGLSKKTHRSSR